MSFFGVTIETLDKIEPIEGADRIVKATLKGIDFSFVIGKDTFKVNDTVLYFPVDSIVPTVLQEKLGVVGRLAGHAKDRIKTVKLKSVYSQGIVGPISLIDDFPKDKEKTVDNITEFLGITKYEPPVVMEHGANLCRLPLGLSKYDIEGVERYQYIVDYMMDKLVRIDEKIEGQNISFSYGKDDQKFYVNQRSHTIVPIEGATHTWWKYAIANNLESIVKQLSNRFGADVTLWGEGIGPGIQGNHYDLKDHRGVFYDIKVGNKFIDTDDFLLIVKEFNLPTTPILSTTKTLREWLDGKTIVEMADAESLMIKKPREGIVIRLMKEEHIDNYGRSIIKKRGPKYLSKTEN